MKPADVKRMEERKLHRALALEAAKPFCQQNGYSIEKLEKQVFFLTYDVAAFAQPSDVKPDGLRNDLATQPMPTLLLIQVNGKIIFETTEHTEKYLKE